ncbi:hypothetical protein C8R43DRAFT_1177955 [Mycena crocata]|nr:hypothetical protein C8R43DRAFT_1177955 [Mycena crocata]
MSISGDDAQCSYPRVFGPVKPGPRAGRVGRQAGKKKLGTTLSWPNIGLEQSSVYGFLGNNVSEGPSRWLCLCGPQRSIPVKNMQNMQNNSCTSQVETALTVADEFRVSASLGTPGIRRNPHHVGCPRVHSRVTRILDHKYLWTKIPNSDPRVPASFSMILGKGEHKKQNSRVFPRINSPKPMGDSHSWTALVPTCADNDTESHACTTDFAHQLCNADLVISAFCAPLQTGRAESMGLAHPAHRSFVPPLPCTSSHPSHCMLDSACRAPRTAGAFAERCAHAGSAGSDPGVCAETLKQAGKERCTTSDDISEKRYLCTVIDERGCLRHALALARPRAAAVVNFRWCEYNFLALLVHPGDDVQGHTQWYIFIVLTTSAPKGICKHSAPIVIVRRLSALASWLTLRRIVPIEQVPEALVVSASALFNFTHGGHNSSPDANTPVSSLGVIGSHRGVQSSYK